MEGVGGQHAVAAAGHQWRERAAGRRPVSRAIELFHEIAGPSFYQRVDVHVDRAVYPAMKARLAVELVEPFEGAAGEAVRWLPGAITASVLGGDPRITPLVVGLLAGLSRILAEQHGGKVVEQRPPQAAVEV